MQTKKKKTFLKKEKFENSLLQFNFFMVKARNWRAGRLHQLPISPITLMCSFWVWGYHRASSKGSKSRGSACLSLSHKAFQSNLQTDPFLSLLHPPSPPTGQPPICVPAGSQPRSSFEDPWTDAHTAHAHLYPVPSLDHMSIWLANPR